MSDVPLPEALIAAATGAVSAERFSSFDRDRALAVLRVTLAFRDESGHSFVWSAEEVEAALCDIEDAYPEDVFLPPPWDGEPSRDAVAAESARHTIRLVRAALARVRGPEPDETWFPIWRGNEVINRGPEKRVSE